MIAIKVKANLKVNSNEMKLEDVVNTTTFIYSRIKHFSMKYNDDNTEMEFSIEYETPDDEFMRLEEIINTNNILGSELTYLNINSEHISVDNDFIAIPIDKVTIPEDADMELNDLTDYYVFARILHGELMYWGGDQNKGFKNKWSVNFNNAKRFATYQHAVDCYCEANNISLRYINSWDTISDFPDLRGEYVAVRIRNDSIVYFDYYEEV